MRLLRPLALQGDADAQFKVGVMYDQGWGVPQNYTLALACFREAAQQGVAGAQFNLGRGLMKRGNLVVPQAAEQGTVTAEQGSWRDVPDRPRLRRTPAGPRVVVGTPSTEQGVDGSSASSGSRYVVGNRPRGRNFRSIVSFAAGLCLIKFVHTA